MPTHYRSDFKGFALQGRLVAPMGVKFGVEKSTQDRAFMPNMTSGEVAWRWFGCPQNCKFYEILEYKCPAAAYPFNPLSNFHKRFMVRLVPYRESCWELALWVLEFWDLTLEVHFTQISPAHIGETLRRMRNGPKLRISSIPISSLVKVGLCTPPGDEKVPCFFYRQALRA